MNRPKDTNLPSLDGLRAFSIGLVILGHAMRGREKHSLLFRLFFLHADLGVIVFFIISGFLITTLLMSERAEFGSISLRLFYIRRALRILPAFCVFVGTTFLLSLLGFIYIPPRLWIYVLTYTVDFVTQGVWEVGHLWSLSVEEQFYLLWPLLMCFAKLRTCVVLAVFAIFWGIFIHVFFVVTGIQLIDPAMGYAFPFVCGPIATGCLLAIAAPWVRRLLNEHRRLSGPAAVALAVALVLLLDTGLGSLSRYTGILKSLLLTFCVARFVFRPQGFTAVALNSWPAVFIGKLSYSLYLWQQLFFDPYSTSLFCKFPLNLCLTLAVACLSYFLIEIKFLNLRHRFRRESIQKLGMPQAVSSA